PTRDLVLMPGSFEDRPPIFPNNVATKPMKNVARAGRSVEGLKLTSLVVGENVPPAVARDGEAKPEALCVSRPLLYTRGRVFAFGFRFEDCERHAPQPKNVVGDDALRAVVHRRTGQVDAARPDLNLRIPTPARFRECGLNELSVRLAF